MKKRATVYNVAQKSCWLWHVMLHLPVVEEYKKKRRRTYLPSERTDKAKGRKGERGWGIERGYGH